MSVETQAILVGHVSAERVASVLRTEVTGQVAVRDMQRSEYKVVEFQSEDGTWTVLHLFLESSVAEDYADAYDGESTFMTAEFSPQNVNLLRAITAALGGFTRRTTGEPWVALEQTRP